MALPKELEKLFKENKNGIITYEKIVNIKDFKKLEFYKVDFR
jgi:hypothetical protein